jgi:NAD(P) transhydrogenase subunit alpha
MQIGIPKENNNGETRVAATVVSVKKLKKMGFKVLIEKDAGLAAGIRNEDYTAEGAELSDALNVWQSDVVLKVNPPTDSEIVKLKSNSLFISLLTPYLTDGPIQKLTQAKVNAVALELVPRTSRAQSMDVLSSQAGIAGYKAAIEAANHYLRFIPMMMTSAGMTKSAKAIVLGAGVAGLQAIATIKRLGAQVEAYDVRAEVKEQIQSLGAKFIELNVGESGTGTGGYAKELSEEGKQKQQQLLTEKLKTADILITTANIPGRKAPILVTEEAVKGMRFGSVIVDMAAATGGNCPLTEADKILTKHGVKIIGITNYPALVPYDSSQFFANNLINLLALFVVKKEQGISLNYNFEDDIIAAACVSYNGELRLKGNK